MSSQTANERHHSDFPGMPYPDDEDVVITSTNIGSFKFPFFDNTEDLDLSRSHNMDRFLSPRPTKSTRTASYEHPINSSTGISSPSDFAAITLSPIAKSRDSDGNREILPHEGGERGRDHGSNHVDDMEPSPISISTSQRSSTTKAVDVSTPPHNPDGDPSELVDDLQSARKHVGETSSNFIDKIRNAAHKRKVAVTRSRDSLVAKEQEQLRSIAESKALKSNKANIQQNYEAKENQPPEKRAESSRFKNPFKSRKSVGFSGCGVPKVEKRPTTTPFSPLLGSRRKQKVPVKALEVPPLSILKAGSKRTPLQKPLNPPSTAPRSSANRPKSTKTAITTSTVAKSSARLSTAFKARPMPSSTGSRGHAGQIGVPKVPKRPVTVPISPGLGKKRQSMLDSTKKRAVAKVASRLPSLDTASLQRSESLRSLGTRSSTPTSGENSGLLGLDFLGATPDSAFSHLQQKQDDGKHTPRYAAIKPFEPQSTKRANERAQYDVIRDENRQVRLLQEREQLHKQIRTIKKELHVLGDQL